MKRAQDVVTTLESRSKKRQKKEEVKSPISSEEDSWSTEYSNFIWDKLPLDSAQVIYLKGKALLEENLLTYAESAELSAALKVIEDHYLISKAEQQRLFDEAETKRRQEQLEIITPSETLMVE